MKLRIGVVGLGYVGLPLFLALSKRHEVVGFDRQDSRVEELLAGRDSNGEANYEEMSIIFDRSKLSADQGVLEGCNAFIITVPTPVDQENLPDLEPILSACKIVGKFLAPGSLVIFESTVFPGCTREVCIPLLEEVSGIKCDTGKDGYTNSCFYVGYSPERINPADHINRIETIVKVISATSEYALQLVSNIYSPVITAGVHMAESIEVAEASKIIENCQRDVNIAFMNEMAMLLSSMSIPTYSVLKAANTKWNFVDFSPGLVGGHCISVDPYYLIHRARQIGARAQLLEISRQVNETIPGYIIHSLCRELHLSLKNPSEITVGFFGITFKRDCSDTRDSKAIGLAKLALKTFNRVLVYDPYWMGCELVGIGKVQSSYDDLKDCDVFIIAVDHAVYERDIKSIFDSCLRVDRPVLIFDVKNLLARMGISVPNSRVLTL